MTRRKWLLGITLLALAGAAFYTRGQWMPDKSNAQAPAPGAGGRVVAVETGKAETKKMPVRLDALGSVTPIASVALKPRVDTTITAVHFQDGANVTKGEKLFTLDCRVMDAQIQTTEGTLARDQAQLAGAERDVGRYTELVGKNATPVTNLDNAKTQTDIYKAAIKSSQGVLDNLKVQRSYCDVTAPISGRISAASMKAGNFVRQADIMPMATIIQMAPVYVSFTVPQKNLADIRQAISAETGTVLATVQGQTKRAQGQVSMIENSVDSATGMAMVRATMPNTDELLWPGTLVNAEVTLRVEDSIVVPSNAVQVSQTGTFVFVVADGKAKVQPVKVDRTVGTETVIASGLNVGETVVTDGQLLLQNGTRVNPRQPGAGGGGPPKAAGS
ncbi:MAG: efflux RND transporter periplasmic adaptor subunit [Pseudolabrys sp.]|nr:efflux RND transporter periplasmic adaptor subunit [Pseudolabrys sp.]